MTGYAVWGTQHEGLKICKENIPTRVMGDDTRPGEPEVHNNTKTESRGGLTVHNNQKSKKHKGEDSKYTTIPLPLWGMGDIAWATPMGNVTVAPTILPVT